MTKKRARPQRKPTEEDARLVAAVDLLRRTGANEVQIRYCEEEKPVVWFAIGRWENVWETASAMNPLRALYRLLDEVIDGGTCEHCGKPAGFEESDIGTMPLNQFVCWYQWDPSTKSYA